MSVAIEARDLEKVYGSLGVERRIRRILARSSG